MSVSEHFDVAIVGGGIAGLYCAMRRPPGRSMALFEATSRFGGKLETVEMAGFQAEYGAMRFDPSRQPVMRALIDHLGLKTEPFPAYMSPPLDERMDSSELRENERHLDALALFSRGIALVLNRTEQELMSASEEELEDIRRHGVFLGKPVWQWGFWNALVEVMSYGAIKFIMSDGSFFHGIHENPGVAGTVITWVKMLQMSRDLRGVAGGMQQVTDLMLQRAEQGGVAVYAGHALSGLSPQGKDVRLSFGDREFTARHVVLALPSAALRTIGGLPEDIRGLLDTVVEYPLVKCFFVVREPWWEENIPQRGIRSFPARELHYYLDGGKGNIMVYADRPSMSFWNRYTAPGYQETADINGDPDLRKVFASLERIDPDRVLSYGIRDWTRAPYGAGVHLWKAGVQSWKVTERLEAFSLSEGGPANVHICGEAFSDYQGFMEGAVRTAESVLGRI